MKTNNNDELKEEIRALKAAYRQESQNVAFADLVEKIRGVRAKALASAMSATTAEDKASFVDKATTAEHLLAYVDRMLEP